MWLEKLWSTAIMAVTGVAIFVCSTANADDDAYYTEYLPGMPPNCEEPLLNRFFPGSTLEGCEAMYKADKFIEWACEEESLTKQRIAPHLLTQADVKWLTNVVNRKRACIDLLASKKKLRLWDTISRWWKGDKD